MRNVLYETEYRLTTFKLNVYRYCYEKQLLLTFEGPYVTNFRDVGFQKGIR